MERKQLNRVVDSMNAVERARAVEGMEQALLLANATLAATTRIRNALNSAGQAMTVVGVRPVGELSFRPGRGGLSLRRALVAKGQPLRLAFCIFARDPAAPP